MKQVYSSIRKVYILFFFLFLINQYTRAQCAGSDTTITICNIPDTNNQNFNLFNALPGTPITGGTWTDNDNLNVYVGTATDIINIWQINQGGVYSYTYTVDPINCTNNTATITLIIGGYPGEDNYIANACEDDLDVNLFQFISNNPSPHFFGTWVDQSNTGALNGSFYNATVQGAGTYLFTYNVPAVGSCSAKTVTVELTVHPLPNPGIDSIIEICGLTDLANYTTLDLSVILIGEQPNGNWTENSGTSEFSNNSDTTIDVQNIFNNFGYGEYDFSYTATPNHPICQPKTSITTLKIQRELDFSNSDFDVNSICENEIGIIPLEALITNLPSLTGLPSYMLDIDYEINGPVNYNSSIQTSLSNPTSFLLDSNFTPTPGVYSITITNIELVSDPNDLICNIIYDLETTFEIWPVYDDLNLNIDDICEGENLSIIINHPDINFNESLNITYDITGANTINNSSQILNFVNGEASFSIYSSLIPNIGINTFKITSITTENNCTSNPDDLLIDFEVFPLPNSNVVIDVENVCFGEPNLIQLSNLTGINQVEIIYSIETGISLNQHISLPVINEQTEFTLPANIFISAGNYSFVVNEIINLETGCSILSNSNQDFEIFPIPNPPTANVIQEFCEVDEATIADLLPNAGNITWYDNQNSIVPLGNTHILLERTYWAAQSNNQNCISDKTPVDVLIHKTPTSTLLDAEFCGADNPTIQDLSNKVIENLQYEVILLDENNNQLSYSTLLEENVVYYIYLHDSVTNCDSKEKLEVFVSLTNCEVTNYDFFVPDAFSPNKDGTNDVFRIPNISFIYPNYEFEIYNRYGKILFKGDIDHPEWDGRSLESDALVDGIAPNGVYFYILHFNKGRKKPQQGRLYLNR